MMDQPLFPLPPLHALRSFHAAALYGRFRDAAAALGLSESAVSHQVRKLEEHLGVRLFDRAGNAVRLTLAGQAYFEEIDPAFTRIRRATEELAAPTYRVSVSLPTSLATFWLLPRLAQMEQAVPGLNLQLVPSNRLTDLRREQIDCAIRYGEGPWPGYEALHLFDEQAFPVCRPGLIPEGVAPDAAFNACRLIVNALHREEWHEWALAHGVPPPTLNGALALDGAEPILHAAAEGLGLAIGRRPLVDRWLQDGRLDAPFGSADESGCAYYFVYPQGVELSMAARRFARWLVGTSKGEASAAALFASDAPDRARGLGRDPAARVHR